ncbi:MAG: hypothetical protein BroJett014_19490 [Planctomycetota bacterium]|nr:hypothetical protein [Planctomycetota bacterium]GIK52976.1 MAG: hypothetical protein BroJett014_19490 [Planctomycetota bacterium]
MIRKLPFLLVLAALALVAHASLVQAEQIKLADAPDGTKGRFLQGEVVEVKPDGFTFKLTETGGVIFLRWNQVDAALKKRLLNEKDPDEGLNLEVLIDGARLELATGDVLMGTVVLQGANYVVTNLDSPRGKTIASEDVIEGGYMPNVKIPATVLKTPEETLKIAEEQRAPLESARQFYELARIADRMGLYEAAKDYVSIGLGMTPDKKLQTRLEEYNVKLDELIRQRDLLNALTEARKAAAKHVYQLALNSLNDAKKKYNPTGDVLVKFEETYNEINDDFSKYVITEWYNQLKIVARNKTKDKKLTWQEGRNWALRELENEVRQAIALKTGGEINDIKARFVARVKEEISMKKISFEETGFYDVVGGHLPSAGNKPNPNGTQPARGPNPGQPGGDRPRNPGPGGSNRSVGPVDGDRDELPQSRDRFQEKPKEGGSSSPSPQEIEDFIRKAKEAYDKAQADRQKQGQGQDLSKLKVPANSPSIDDWWKTLSRTAKANWLVAIYVRFGGTMTVYEQEYWDIKYK